MLNAISVAVWMISMKLGMTMHVPTWRAIKILKIWKSKRWAAAVLKFEKLRYLQNHVANFDAILHEDTLVLQSLPTVQKFRF